ncbi:MAG: 6-phosphogluconolactonase [Armatimonadetes bacterium]|nr:6-phosphogluconolactonase [Armatimonadota bacterium]NIM24446.1 6-phosphogluconolactonase [Armatimonadota bacterium]NIM68317.1 6-phosphogluconolactonase [Armatimonadota bacterium]NIM76721.1 6-phosphogluconolactonase [Armatimonadota bacterium]NIN06520.1 6-phosphogluconolactonase [Armatimonadota bacterium]
MVGEIEIVSDENELALAGGEHFTSLAVSAISAQGRFSVALSGGRTPRAIYEQLGGAFAPQIDWRYVHIFWGDERCVPPDHPDSNYRMARRALLNHVPIPEANIHPIHTETEPEKAAAAYERELRGFFADGLEREGGGGRRPAARFDLVLLGMGADGHTASLFPYTAALYERMHWVVAYYVEKLNAWRVTLTPTAINAAANVIFIASGESKAKRLKEVLAASAFPGSLPAQMIKPTDGNLLWLVDAAAAEML